jgi:hypothetical protein
MNNIGGLLVMQNIYYDCPYCRESVLISHHFTKEFMEDNKLNKNVINKVIELQATRNSITIPWIKIDNKIMFHNFLQKNENIIWKHLYNNIIENYLDDKYVDKLCMGECCNEYLSLDDDREDSEDDEVREDEDENEYEDDVENSENDESVNESNDESMVNNNEENN